MPKTNNDKRICKCISLNRPQKYQTTPSRKMKMLCGILHDGEKQYKEVYVDECIADDIKKLWENGIFTQSSCCGHNGMFGKKSVVISNESDYKKARKLLPDFEICYWKLIRR